jgi:hypothetical protein
VLSVAPWLVAAVTAAATDTAAAKVGDVVGKVVVGLAEEGEDVGVAEEGEAVVTVGDADVGDKVG